MTVKDESIEFALQRFRDFLSVNVSRDRGDRPEAVECLSAALGLPEEKRRQLGEGLQELVPEGMAVAWAMMGVLVGLSIAEAETGLFLNA